MEQQARPGLPGSFAMDCTGLSDGRAGFDILPLK
jgi:hypothetical protein